MIRLAPRLAAATADLGRGVALLLEAMTPAAFRAAVAETVIEIDRLGEDAPLADREDAAFRVAWDHFVTGWTGVEDETGVPVPPTAETREALFALAPEMRWRARVALNAHMAAGREAVEEGNASAASPSGGGGAGPSTAPTAAPSPGAGGVAAPASAATPPAPKTPTP